jgi:hypothetical protein
LHRSELLLGSATERHPGPRTYTKWLGVKTPAVLMLAAS